MKQSFFLRNVYCETRLTFDIHEPREPHHRQQVSDGVQTCHDSYFFLCPSEHNHTSCRDRTKCVPAAVLHERKEGEQKQNVKSPFI